MRDELEAISQEIIKAEALIDALEEEQIRNNAGIVHSEKEVRLCYALKDVIARIETILEALA